MAGDWLKMEVALPEKPEVWQMAGILRIDPDAVVGKVFKVWRWFDAHTANGNAAGVTYALVDSLTGVTGFGEAMALCGWLEQDGSLLKLPHFDRHNGKTAKDRALTAKRVASCKAKGNAEGNVKGNARSVTDALPREEKRREEEEQEKRAASMTPEQFKADLFKRWKALPTAGGGSFLNKLFREHKPEQRVLEAVERTLDHGPADPVAFVLGALRKEAKADDDYAKLMAGVK